MNTIPPKARAVHTEAEEGAFFRLLHEIGHVGWRMNPERRGNFPLEEVDLFADLFAFERLVDIMGREKALDILVRCGSANDLVWEMD